MVKKAKKTVVRKKKVIKKKRPTSVPDYINASGKDCIEAGICVRKGCSNPAKAKSPFCGARCRKIVDG